MGLFQSFTVLIAIRSYAATNPDLSADFTNLLTASIDLGVNSFHGALWSFNRSWLLGAFATLTDRDAANLESFPIDLFRCPSCGLLELYDLDRSLPEA